MSGAWQMCPIRSFTHWYSLKLPCPQSWPTTNTHHMKNPEGATPDPPSGPDPLQRSSAQAQVSQYDKKLRSASASVAAF
jgi:hypothetical protein